MRGRWIALAGVAVVVGVAAWLAFRASPSEEPRRQRDVPAVGGGTTPAAGLRSDAPPRDRPAGHARIVGTVTRGGKPASARIEARFSSEVDGGGRGLDYVWNPDDAVRAPPRPDAVRGVATAGADGRFAMEGLPPGGYIVHASAEDGARGDVWAVLPLDGAAVEANPELRLGTAALRGRGVRSDGSPWRGIVILDSSPLDIFGEPSRRLADPVATDAGGRFTFGGLEPGPVHATAIDPGVSRTIGPTIDVPFEGEWKFVVDAGFAAFEGRVVSDADGAPVAGADVVALARSGSGGAEAAVRAATGADGSFRVLLPPARGRLTVRAAGFRPGKLTWFAGAKRLDVRLLRPGRVTGRVTSEADGKPVSGVTVRAVEGRESWRSSLDPRPATTDAEGRYTIEDAPPGDALLYVLDRGWISKGLPEVRDSGGNALTVSVVTGASATLDLVVVPSAEVVGTILDPAGAPLAGAYVHAVADSRGEGNVRTVWMLGKADRVSGPEGRVVFDNLLPGYAYEVEASAPGLGRGYFAPLAPRLGGVTPFEIRMPAPRFAVVRVMADSPVEGVLVKACRVYDRSSGGGSWSDTVTSGRSGSDGVARVGPLPAGAIAIWSDDSEHRSTATLRETIAGSEAEGVAELSATLSVAAGGPVSSISGRAALADGSPAAGCQIFVGSIQGGGVRGAAPEDSDAQGRFRFRGLPPGRYRLRGRLLHVLGVHEGSVEADSGSTDVKLVVEPPSAKPGSFVVHVVDGDGAMVANAELRMRGSHGASTTNAQAGQAAFQQVERGSTLEVWGAKDENGRSLPWGPTHVDGIDPAARETTVRLPPEKRIEGRVVGPDGAGFPSVEVLALPGSTVANGRNDREAHGSGRSGADGAFSIGGLGSEEYGLEVRAPAPFVIDGERPVSSGGATGVVIRVKKGFVAVITVVDPEGRPVPGASVNVGFDFKTPVHTRRIPKDLSLPRVPDAASTDALGIARLEGLDPSSHYTLRVEPRRSPEFLPWSSPSWTPADTLVSLPLARRVAGVVRDLAGGPVPGVGVQRGAGTNSWSGTQTDADGAFRFEGVPDGEVVLRVVLGLGIGVSGAKGTEVVVRAGDEHVMLEIDAGPTIAIRIDGLDLLAMGRPRLNLFLTEEGMATESMLPPRLDTKGRLWLRGLKADATYVLFVSDRAGAFAYEVGLRPSAEEHVVTLKPGAAITGRLTLPLGATNAHVQASGPGFSVSGKVDADGAYRIEGLPAGTWKVTATAKGEKPLEGTAEVAAGASADIELRPR